MKKLVVLTGAGISAESGFETFRDSGGLWEKYPVEKVATPEGWHENPDLVTDFYNGLRAQLIAAQPNDAHRILAELERQFDVTVVTQNVDDLHERAADPDDPRYQETLTRERIAVHHGERAGDGSLLRPWIVWFGEAVPNLEAAAEETASADIFVIVGSSLNVYPAAGLVRYAPADCPVYLIDPKEVHVPSHRQVHVIQDIASRGMKTLQDLLLR